MSRRFVNCSYWSLSYVLVKLHTIIGESKRRKKKNRKTTMTHTYTSIYFQYCYNPSLFLNRLRKRWHTHTLALPVVLMSIDIKQCARNYVKMVVVVVVVVFGRISTLVSLATLTEANQTDEKRRKKERRMFVHKMPEIRFVILYVWCNVYTLFLPLL